MKKILASAAVLVLVGGASAFAGGYPSGSVGPAVSGDCASGVVDENNNCIVVAGPVSSADSLLLGGLGSPALVAGIAAAVLIAAVAGAGSTSDTQDSQ
jgi:hypothetical protein